MRAIVLPEFGPPDVLVERQIEDPVPGPGEALIDVELSSVTFVETQVRAGRAPHPSMLPELPVVLGNGVGGTVIAVGARTPRTLIGTRVISTTGGSGGYAERVAVPAGGLIAIPDSLAMSDGVALLADGRTAVALLERAAVKPDETVLVEAAAGGVGSLLVQLAHAAGARVIAAAGGERKLELARDLGADITVDYTDPAWTEVVRSKTGARRGAGVLDVVFDGVGASIGRAAFGLLARGGRYCAFGMAGGEFAQIDEEQARAREVSVIRGAAPNPDQRRALTESALGRALAGELHPVIGQTFPLGSAADAHRAIESRRTVGKTLLFTDL